MLSLLTGAATTLGGTLANKGLEVLLESRKGKIILWRAINKTAKKFKGHAPGGKSAVKGYLKIWTNSLDFVEVIQGLEEGKSVDRTVTNALGSFKRHSVSSLNKNAQTVLAYFFNQVNEGLLKSSRGLTLVYNRILMRFDELSEEIRKGNEQVIKRLDKQDDTLEELVKRQNSLSENQRSAFDELLSATQEWSSIKNYLEIGAFNDAKKEIEHRLNKLNEIYKDKPDSKEIFRDHHVELLLKLASLLSNLGEYQISKSTYSEAKRMGIETPYLKRLESKVLINLNMVSELESLVNEGKLQDREIAEMELLFLKGKMDEIFKMIPEKIDNYRLIYLGLVAKINELDDKGFSEKALQINEEIERAYQLSGSQPLYKIQVADIAIKYLHRLCFSLISVEGLNRNELVESIRLFINTAMQACKEVDYKRGLVSILRNALQFYSLLEEEEAIRATEKEIQRYNEVTESSYEFDLKRGNISRAIELHNKAVKLVDNSEAVNIETAEHLFQAAFELSDQEEKGITGRSLVNFYLRNNKIDKAENVLKRLTGISEHTRLLIKLSIFERKESAESVLSFLKDLVKQFPRSIQFRRYYVEILIQTISKKRNESGAEDNDDLIKEVKSSIRSLNDLLPTDSNCIYYAKALIANKDFNNAVKVLKKVSKDTKVYISALKLIAHCFVESERFHEVPEVFEELSEITNDPKYANEAASYYLNNNQIEYANNLLDKWVIKFPDDPALIASYAVSIISKNEVTPEEAQQALDLLIRANRLKSGFTNIYLAMAKAAQLAGNEKKRIEYLSKNWSDVPLISINRKEDFRQLNQKMDKGIVRVDMIGKEGIKAFIEWNKEFITALNTFHRNDLMTYIDTFARNGQAWSQWIGWTSVADENYYKDGFSMAIKSPWPFTGRAKSERKGLLLDLTALLSLCVLSQTDKIIREIINQGSKVFLRVEELRKLRSTVKKPEEILFDIVKFPFDELYDLFKKSGLIVDYSKVEWDEYSGLVSDEKHVPLGNHAPDYGLSLSLENSRFILDKVDGLDQENIQSLENLTSSKVLLKAFVNKGLIGENEADAASNKNERFRDWNAAEDIDLPESVVFSAFSVQHWYETGLLTVSNKDWVNGKELWPKVTLGPFAINYLRNEAKVTNNGKKLNSLASNQLTELESLISEGLINILPDTVSSKIDDTSWFSSSNVNAIRLLDLAKSKDLNLWTDDRVLGYLLWPFNHPLPIQELREELSQLHKKYSSINFFSTEDVLEKILTDTDTQEFSEKMGYRLVELGYRPLNFRLASDFLLKNYSYNPESPKYKSFLQTLEGHLVDEYYDKESEVDPKPLQRLFLARIVPGILANILLKQTGRPFEERKQFASDILSVMIKYIDRHRVEMKDKMASFWTSLLHEIVDYQTFKNLDIHEKEGIDIRLHLVLEWFSESLLEHEDGDNLKRAVIAIEDFIVQNVVNLKSLASNEDIAPKIGATDRERNENVRILITKRIQLLIQPLLNDSLIGLFNPLLRRCLGHISLFPHEFKLDEVYWFEKDDEKFKDQISEDELELFALDIFKDIINGNREYGKFLTADLRVFCTWNRLKPSEVRSKDDYIYGASVNISMLRLILRDELHTMPQVIMGIITQLQLIDPILGKDIQVLSQDLIDDIPSKRKKAREQAAFSIISSIYFELQRNLSHAFLRVQEINTEELKSFLSPKPGWLSGEVNLNITEFNETEFPRDVLVDAALLVYSPEDLYNNCNSIIDNFKSNVEKGNNENFDLLSFYATLFEEEISSFKIAHRLLEFLILSSSGQEKIIFRGLEIQTKVFLKELLIQILEPKVETTSQNGMIYRSPNLKIIHSCLLRLSLFVNGSPKHINAWNNKYEETDKVIEHLINNVLIFSHRLIPFLKGQFGGKIEDLKFELLDAVKSLSIAYEEPQSFPDRFNPLLLGPHLLDHEVSSVLHVLKVFISGNENPETILDFDHVLELAKPWSETNNIEAEEIYEEQKEKSSNAIKIKMPMSPKEAAEELIEVIKRRLSEGGDGAKIKE